MKPSNARACVASLLAACFAQNALADDGGGSSAVTPDCGESVTAEILTILRDAGNIDQGQFEALCRKARGETTPAVAAAGPAAESDKPTWKFKWSNGFNLQRSDGKFKLKFGGRVQLDGALIGLDSDLAGDFRDAGINPLEGNGVEFRRARFFFSGTVYERLYFKAQYDFAQPEDDDNPDFKDLYVGLKFEPLQVQVGHFKEPMLLE